METGDEVTEEYLIKNGWEKVCSFPLSIIWKKREEVKNRRIVWDIETQKVFGTWTE